MFKKYGFWGSIKLIRNLLGTKLFFPSARLIRFPIDIRNKRYMDFGKGLTTGIHCRLEAHPKQDQKMPCIRIGKNVQMNDYVHIVARESVQIGDYALLASKIFISDLNHGSYGSNNVHINPHIHPMERALFSSSVKIENNVWICEFVSVLPGVTIGEGSIIGSMSVVTKSIPPYSIAVGCPAKVIKKFNFD